MPNQVTGTRPPGDKVSYEHVSGRGEAPGAGFVATGSGVSKWRGRRLLLLLLALFVLPLLIVGAMYQFDWRPQGGSHGQLISPPRPLQLDGAQTLQGGRFDATQWQGHWNLVYVALANCDAACEAQLGTLRQVHASLGKEIGRIQRVLLVPTGGTDQALARIHQQYPDLVVLVGDGAQNLARQFGATLPEDGVYLVDPLGNLMMRYPAGYDAKGIRRDLMRLLNYSWTG